MKPLSSDSKKTVQVVIKHDDTGLVETLYLEQGYAEPLVEGAEIRYDDPFPGESRNEFDFD